MVKKFMDEIFASAYHEFVGKENKKDMIRDLL